ncbi:MAG: hypothetical protein VYB51_05300, partial [Gemmatimonadota bacterium]|nr:hypothetical protein [Gemmatimonadota bacterium]
SEVAMSETPRFQVRAAGSFEQKPGCPPDALSGLPADRIERLCRGECYNPSDARRQITRIEVVRIVPGIVGGDAMKERIEDPWKVLSCPTGGNGCVVEFDDPSLAALEGDVLYYARAIEEATPTVDADPLRCTRDASGRCIEVNPCFLEPESDDCLSPAEHRAWSSPIFVNDARS